MYFMKILRLNKVSKNLLKREKKTKIYHSFNSKTITIAIGRNLLNNIFFL